MLFAATTVLAVLVTGCANPLYDTAASPEDREPETTSETVDGGAPEECGSGAITDYAFDVSDDRRLVGYADNVFVGRVVERLDTEGSIAESTTPFGPRTRFSVEVLENVKGALEGSVTMSQEGGYDPYQGCVVQMRDDPLLKPGEEAMFVTRHDEGRGWYQIAAADYGDTRIESEQQREDLVQRFERAKKHQTNSLR